MRTDASPGEGWLVFHIAAAPFRGEREAVAFEPCDELDHLPSPLVELAGIRYLEPPHQAVGSGLVPLEYARTQAAEHGPTNPRLVVKDPQADVGTEGVLKEVNRRQAKVIEENGDVAGGGIIAALATIALWATAFPLHRACDAYGFMSGDGFPRYERPSWSPWLWAQPARSCSPPEPIGMTYQVTSDH